MSHRLLLQSVEEQGPEAFYVSPYACALQAACCSRLCAIVSSLVRLVIYDVHDE